MSLMATFFSCLATPESAIQALLKSVTGDKSPLTEVTRPRGMRKQSKLRPQ